MHPIKRERAKQRLPLRELGRRSGVPAGTISGIERGTREPHILTLAKIADGLGMDLEALTEELSSPKAPAPSSLPDEVLEERRIIFDTPALVLDEINGWFGDYLRALVPEDLTPSEVQRELSLIKGVLAVVEALLNNLSENGVFQMLNPYVVAISTDQPVPDQLRQAVIDLHNATTALFTSVVPLAHQRFKALQKQAKRETGEDELEPLRKRKAQWKSDFQVHTEIGS